MGAYPSNAANTDDEPAMSDFWMAVNHMGGWIGSNRNEVLEFEPQESEMVEHGGRLLPGNLEGLLAKWTTLEKN
ncbi:hypothetical protein N7447_007670 [Penicillium robsamsonii]|uniref:uncharacterized protein n=1 Tax=Penicillium robsamsonii TaxID=1792511 RepID=UPI0025499FB0|nr:uncharacterized protein N7447_007670 [Penicillium robsamsonii]KAJ5817662.1 hypothetical protein N7447_007670 [Penicillium robsamsonii]